ncbi:MAG: roadblock/LC7 domain-containing protein [Gemmatimonadales bacterium]|nr:roadblock/LC7 domain-containing protein [Gemmatimonadales bacterium]
MIDAAQDALDRLTRVRGVRGALLVSTEDGLVVAEAIMEGVAAKPIAALAASTLTRLARAMPRAGLRAPQFVQLRAERGMMLAAPAGDDLLVVAIADPTVNVGLVRLELLDVVAAVVGR